MDPVFRVVRDQASLKLQLWADATGRGLIEALRRMGRGVVRRLLELTPPAHGSVTGAAAYRYGRKRISRDLLKVLAPRRLKGKRKITHVFGRPLRRPIFVPTKEKYPDVRMAYREVARFRNQGVGVRTGRVRDVRYVDRTKFKALEKRLHSHVGRLASGWVAAAAALEVPVQAWIRRHGGSRGAVKMNLVTAHMSIQILNRLPSGLPGHVRSELERRVPYAVKYQREAMIREAEYILLKRGQQAGLVVRRPIRVPAGMFGGDRVA